MMTFLYNLAFILFAIGYAPVFFLKIKQSENPRQLIKERLGLLSESFQKQLVGKRIVWIHAVSVGEVMAVKKFIEGFIERFPGCHIVLTTVTATGQKIAKQIEGPKVSVCYFPFDLTGPVRNFFRILDPEYIILMETEIWPNLILEARRFRVPIGIVNARLSARSAQRYSRFLFLFRRLFSSIDFALVQSQQDAKRFLRLGIEANRIQVLGNMKFDNQSLGELTGQDADRLKKEWRFEKQDFVIIAGSTHPGEEGMVAQVYARLKQENASLKLLIAPRHIERASKILKMFKKMKYRVALASQLDQDSFFDVLILDRLGVLKQLYAFADIVFVGGSLVKHGGQNPIEPADYRRAMIHGPYVQNFENIYRALDQQGGAILIRDASELLFACERLARNPRERAELGKNAFEVVASLRGATERYLQCFEQLFHHSLERERKDHAKIYQNLFSTHR